MSALIGIACAGCMVGDSEDGDVMGDHLTDEQPETLTTAAVVCATGPTVRGIDVSVYQGSINWTSVKNAGIEFAFIRVSDGLANKDAKFATNWAGAKAAGVLRGAYQFFRPTQDVNAQADMLINALGGVHRAGDLPPVVDVEAAGGLAPATVAARARQWVDRVTAKLGVRPIVYTGKYFWRDQVGSPASFSANRLWIASYTTAPCPDIPSPWTRWSFWQYTDKGAVGGIAGAVDRNRFNGSLADLRALANASMMPTSPGAVTGEVNTDGTPLTIRTTASTTAAALGTLANGTVVSITCQKRGDTVAGTFGSSDLWDKVGNGFVSDVFVRTGSDGQVAPTCP